MTRLVAPILLLLFSLLSCSLWAQTFVGFQGSNYAGIYAVDLQPAAIADNRLKYDISLIGLSTTLTNNYVNIAGSAILNGDWRNINSDNYRGFLLEELNGKSKSVYLNYDIQLPGAMIALSPKHGIAITSRWRSFLNIDGLEEPGARFAFNLLDLPTQFGEEYSNPGLRINLLNYFELGFGYGRVLHNKGPHFLKGGGRLKLLSGLAGVSVYADSLRYSFLDDHTLSVQQANISYAHSTVLDGIENDFNVFQDFGQLRFNDMGLGLDLGLVYEYRPDHEEHYVGQGENRVAMQDQNKYKFRIGLSVLDIGGIPFTQSERSQDFSGTVLGYDLNQLDLKGVADFDSAVQAEFVMTQGNEDFTMGMPTAVSLQFDLQLRKRLFLNFSPYLAFKRGSSSKPGIHSISHASLTPRWESKWFGLGVPFSLSEGSSMDVGFMFRAGPIVIGSSNLTSALFGSNMSGADLRFGLRAPIPYRKTRESDIPETAPEMPEQISEAKPGRPGKEVAMDRPDKQKKPKGDKEKKPSKKDRKAGKTDEQAQLAEAAAPENPQPEAPAPNVSSRPGAGNQPEMGNSPEKPVNRPPREVSQPPQPTTRPTNATQPKPEITEATEKPASPAAPSAPPVTPQVTPVPPAAGNASPAEPVATAPTERPGREANVPANAPETFLPEAGERPEKNAKPPVTYDPIIVNKPEFSPDRPFVNETTIQYLPFADADGDGIINRDDICPDLPGLAALQGCPPEEGLADQEDFQELDAFHRLYFNSGSTELGPFEKEMLRQVVFVLKDNPGKMLLIHGNTDGSTTEKRNENLARQRCEITKEYLVSKGISPKRLVVIPHGADRPASTNLSENGRQLNRRVELVLEDE